MMIWWLSQESCEVLSGSIDTLGLPDWLCRQFHSRDGRAGRGRLWSEDSFGVEEIEWDDAKPMAPHAAKCGGIVIPDELVWRLVGLPGFVTDLQLNLFSTPVFRVGDRVVSCMRDETYGARGTVTKVLTGRGGQRYVYEVELACEMPETGILPLPAV